jgi:diguanylate cyclase (GGDEF)-like protein
MAAWESRHVWSLPIGIVGLHYCPAVDGCKGRRDMTQASPGRDPIVELFNRQYVLDEVEGHLKRYRRRRRPFSLLMVDIRNMAWIEDTFGRAVGDSALGDLADFISTNVREVDVWFLCTRDQFILVMDETDAQAAHTVAERLAAEAENPKFILAADDVALEISFSTASCPDDGVEAEALLRAAGFPLERVRTGANRHP